MQDLFQKSTEECSPEENQIMAELFQKFSNTFSKDEINLGRTTLVEHHIDNGDAKPIKQTLRGVPMAYANEEKNIIDKMQKQGIIQKSTSPWSSPLLLAMKKNGTVRPCVDYRKLNSVTTKGALPRIQDCLDTVSGAALFSTFDLTSSFHQRCSKNSLCHQVWLI